MKKIILASGSPRRRELMQQMELDFTVDTSGHFEEIIPEGMCPDTVPSYFAEGKSLAFPRTLEKDEIIVSADTVVICDGQIMGKPHGKEGALEMLEKLSGKTHKVVSAVCVRSNKGYKTLSDTALVTFNQLSHSQIEHYVERYSPTDKAGAYGIQEWIGLIGCPEIKGSFYTIMGLPTHLLYQLISEYE